MWIHELLVCNITWITHIGIGYWILDCCAALLFHNFSIITSNFLSHTSWVLSSLQQLIKLLFRGDLMAPRAEDLLDISCYSEFQSAASAFNSYSSPYYLPPNLSYAIPIPMASNNPQHSQAQVQLGVRFSQPQHQYYVAPGHPAPSEQTLIPHFLPPAQPVPVLSSFSSDNKVVEYADPSPSHVGGCKAQSYYGVQGINNLPAQLFQYQPQLGYTIPYKSQPAYNITSFPLVLMQASIPPRSELLSQTPYTTAPLCHPQSYFTVTVPTIQHAQATVERPPTHRHSRNWASAHVEPPPAAIVDDRIGHLHSTPVLQWMSSGCFHDDDRRMYVKDLAPQLKQELASDISQSATLANTVFPTHCLPFPVNNSLLEHLACHNVWNIEGAHFLQKPKSLSEDNLAEWLNILGRIIGLAYNKKCLQIWSASTCNLPPSGSKTIWKPDLVLLDREDT